MQPSICTSAVQMSQTILKRPNMCSCGGQRSLCSCSIIYRKKNAALPWCRSFQVHLSGGLNSLYLCICFPLWFGEVFAIISSNTLLIRFLVLFLLGPLLYIDQRALYYPIGLLYYNLLKKHRLPGSCADGGFPVSQIMCLLLYVTHSAVYCSAFALVNEFSTFSCFLPMASSCFLTIICISINSPS